MAPRRVQVNKLDYKKLSANDVICPICRSILIKPVTLPCSHGFCASCFETTTQNANLVCPVCRVRIGSWLRTATKSKKLINETFWQAIQASFPLQIRNKLNGLDAKSVAEKNEKRDEVNKKKEDKFSERLTVPSTSTRNPAKKAVLLNNFASKEYTCRILCQNTKESQKHTPSESLTIIQRKNKRVQKITESESNDRSNSIESECLYFKPIDYRHNPPSEGLAPIKVPTRKPNVNANAKILAPCGQNQINMNSLESAFARLFCPVISDEERNKNEANRQESTSKRKLEKTESKSRKKIKKPNELESEKKSEELPKLCDNRGVENINFSLSSHSNNVKKSTGLKHLSNKLFTEEDVKRSLQEKADFELATKLQQTFNQTSKYSTRSAVLKRMAATKQINIEGIMTPFEVN